MNGYSEKGTPEEQKTLEEFKAEYDRRLAARKLRDIALGNGLRREREKYGISMFQFAKKIGCEIEKIGLWELGFETMSEEDLKKYCRALVEW